MSNQDTMTKLGTVLLGTCTNPEHKWTTTQLFGTRHVFKQCIDCRKAKEANEGRKQ